MLSRVADSIYWMSRYIERAEHTSRLIDVNLKQMLDESPEMSGRRWSRVVACLRTDPPKDDHGASEVATWMMFDRTNPDSIATCVAVARENARQIRETLSADFWEFPSMQFAQVSTISLKQSGRLPRVSWVQKDSKREKQV